MLFRGNFKLFVCLKVKVSEEDDQRKHVTDMEDQPSCWEATWPYKRRHCMGHSEEELDKL